MICIVGDILTDVMLNTPLSESKMRLGGIVHAARGLWAMGIDYACAYFAPSYLDCHINFYLGKIACSKIIKLGNVINNPYTMLIEEAKEIGNQGYEQLYRDTIDIEYNLEEIGKLKEFDQLMFISGNYDMNILLNNTNKDQYLYADVANNIKDINDLPTNRLFETLFVSTSSDLFTNRFKDGQSFFEMLKPFANNIVLKENRGGSRNYNSRTGEIYYIPAQTCSITHSVGVGDVYDVSSIVAPSENLENRLYYASWVAMQYAKTTFVDNFQQSVQGTLKISADRLKAFEGCFLPWEVRQHCQIYIAAPDFDFMDRALINTLSENLKYHNFCPHRPILENGQMTAGADKKERQYLYHADIALLDKCNMLIAVLMNNDPGTLIEIGMAVQRRMPTLVYDPKGIADNCMLTECPTLVSSDLDTIMVKVFIEYSKLYKNGTL